MLNTYERMYQEKLISPARALELVPDGGVIVTGGAGQEPETFLAQLHTIVPRLTRPVELYNSGSDRLPPFLCLNDPACYGRIRCNPWFYMSGNRKGAPEIVSYTPVHYHAMTERFPHERVSVFISGCTPMDRHGFVRLPLSLAYERQMMERADIVMMEVNPNLPNVYGDNEVHISEIDYLYEVDTKPQLLPEIPLSETDMAIGRNVAALVNDGDTIQLGIGAIPNSVAKALHGKKDLGVHTEMLSSSIVELARERVITGRKKTLFPGKIVAAFVYGDAQLYDFIHENPCVQLMDAKILNDPVVIARNDNMVSINTCLQVDLTGQVCSESIGSRQYSGSGGQNDTAEGAIHARNGRSIIAVHAAKKGDSVSTIVPALAPGAVVSLSRNNLDYLVTEYGTAALRGKSVRDRVRALVGVAHPKFRRELWEKALEFGMVTEYDTPPDFTQ